MFKKGTFFENVKEKSRSLPEKYSLIIENFAKDYEKAVLSSGLEKDRYFNIFYTFLKLIGEQLKQPFNFEPYHKSIRAPFDYYQFGIEFIRPLVDIQNSTLQGKNNIEKMLALLQKKENVVLLANHQTEPDPQLISLILEKDFPSLPKHLTFVAGERVVLDPLAIPLSMGCNLLCIYSKKHIDRIPHLKTKKQLHNKSTMQLMSSLFAKGGFAVYVAPSGGRDRPGENEEVEVAPFDPQSIEMFYLMAKKSGVKTHFFPLALSTYDVLPPPNEVQKEMGEERKATRSAIHFSFGEEIEMEDFPGNDVPDKTQKRQNRAVYIHNLVAKAYKNIKREYL